MILRLRSWELVASREPRVVLWGGHLRDIQFGSRQDRGRARRLDLTAATVRSLNALATNIGRALLPGMTTAVREFERMGIMVARSGIPADEALRRMAANVALLGGRRNPGRSPPSLTVDFQGAETSAGTMSYHVRGSH